jgi:hypothetical protein
VTAVKDRVVILAAYDGERPEPKIGCRWTKLGRSWTSTSMGGFKQLDLLVESSRCGGCTA